MGIQDRLPQQQKRFWTSQNDGAILNTMDPVPAQQSPLPPQAPSTPPVPQHHTKLIIALLVTFTILTLIGLGTYLLAVQKEVATPTPVPTSPPSPTPTDPTANWKMYTSKSFSFKYPSEWETVVIPSGPAYYDPSLEGIKLKISANSSLSILALNNTENPYQGESNLPQAKQIQVSGRRAAMIYSASPVPFTRISVEGQDDIGGYQVVFEWGSSNDISATLVDQILSTFTFTN